MATETPLIHDGAQTTLSTANDARRSSITGTTQAGPNGSGQYLAVFLSTGRQVTICSTTFQNMSTSTPLYGVLQNTPAASQAADVGIFGVTKLVGGSTGIVFGTQLQTSSTSAGVAVPYIGGNGRPFATAIEACTAVGAIFTAALYGGLGAGCTST